MSQLLDDMARAICEAVEDPVNPSMVRYWEPTARAAAAVVAARIKEASEVAHCKSCGRTAGDVSPREVLRALLAELEQGEGR